MPPASPSDLLELLAAVSPSDLHVVDANSSLAGKPSIHLKAEHAKSPTSQTACCWWRSLRIGEKLYEPKKQISRDMNG
eukprot:5142240-Pleurochrysis_carterae.AAC.1